ncbi:YgiQ family radical SAM protein [Floccifex sp.]|uniref:YgiQ family radical SAM protein n=1 Tax=Floccifex sp. TaxID=2815810 RepID=UPI002A75643C|nr:YgiQ family radical SAM protein [Floccifex sp.]MDD7281104.1 YgiQ family radical SAM protein [Erysipelotrichaceae bacterium]MDY2958833.1 YgiQ family radical SAM protein [Floccifex sp.]
MSGFLPVTRQEMIERGWEQPDFVYVSGDAYVDHPSFGAAIITRVLESHGYKVCMLAQPNWKTTEDFKRFGKPRLGFLVSSGNIDSMVNHYSVSKRRRKQDLYSNNGESGHRPDRAVIVYCQKIREAYKDATIIIGGIEASLRRLGHYDYWSDTVRQSILVDSSADLLMFGMGENSIVEIADALDSGIDVQYLTYLDGTVYRTKDLSNIGEEYIVLPSFEEIKNDKKAYAQSFYKQYLNTDHYASKILVEPYQGFYIVQNHPNRPLTQMEFDDAYSLPYMRTYHPMYDYIPAIEEVKFSLTSNRGCFGACNFCALNFHQGRIIQTRSHESLIEEAKILIQDPNFKGYIHDVGGPTANFRQTACDKQKEHGACPTRQCLWPKPCKNLKVDHSDYTKLLKELRSLDGVKKVFVRSGIRYDYLYYDKDDTFFRELVQNHISGQLKVAPEHISNQVLDKMGKPRKDVYFKFVEKYEKLNKEYNKNQYLVPYLMSSHPGSDLNAAIELAEYLRDIHHQPEQVQDFYPTPGTLSTAMYYTGLDPRDMKPVYVAKTPKEKAMQRALMQYKNPRNYDLVYEALTIAGRTDLIGYDSKCLIRPKKKG